MKKLLLSLLLLLFLPSAPALAQCSGVFTAGQVCGSRNGGLPGPISPSLLSLRTQLTANTTFYVNGSVSPATCGTTGALTCGGGSDSVTAAQAQSPSTPFLTLDHACAAITAAYDAAGFIPT